MLCVYRVCAYIVKTPMIEAIFIIILSSVIEQYFLYRGSSMLKLCVLVCLIRGIQQYCVYISKQTNS